MTGMFGLPKLIICSSQSAERFLGRCEIIGSHPSLQGAWTIKQETEMGRRLRGYLQADRYSRHPWVNPLKRRGNLWGTGQMSFRRALWPKQTLWTHWKCTVESLAVGESVHSRGKHPGQHIGKSTAQNCSLVVSFGDAGSVEFISVLAFYRICKSDNSAKQL